jgi:hypothetical protein
MTTNITGFHGTRISANRRTVYNGEIFNAPILGYATANIFKDSDAVHRAVKGLFKERPDLIFASLQHVALEVAVQLGTEKSICSNAGISSGQLTQTIRELSRFMPISLISKAVSRMKQHDRDLANDVDTKVNIALWRRDNRQPGSAEERVATRMKSLWANRASNAIHQIEEANKLKKKHPKHLSTAPTLSVCGVKKNNKGACVEFTTQMIKNLFSGVK